MTQAATQQSQPTTLGGSVLRRRWYVIVLAVVILFFSCVRIRLRNIPLERDEGEYAYVGQLILQGIPPYELAYNMKLPGTYAAYSVLMAVFGQTPAGIHLGLMLVNAVTVVLVFLLVMRLFGELAGVTAAVTYALLSTSEAVLGLQGHATHFVVLAAIAGLLALLKGMDRRRTWLYFAAGFLLGLAFVAKQPGAAFTAFGGLCILVNEWQGPRNWQSARHFAVYSAGALLPFGLTCLILFLAGDLGRMWFWTISYARQYATVTNLWNGTQNFFVMGSLIIEPFSYVWMLAALGVAALIWDVSLAKKVWFVVAFLIFSAAAVCAGFYFRPHYFILLLPVASMLVGIAVASATHEIFRLSRNRAIAALPTVVFCAAVIASIAGEGKILFHMDPIAICRQAYGRGSPFPEALVVAGYLKQRTSGNTRIAVLGSEPEIYFYAQRHSATGYIYMYPFFEPQDYAVQMQREMIGEIEKNRPEYIVFVDVSTSWQIRPAANAFILEWFRKYSRANYELVGVADEVEPETRYVWGDSTKGYTIQGGNSLEIFKRKDS